MARRTASVIAPFRGFFSSLKHAETILKASNQGEEFFKKSCEGEVK